MKLLIENLLDKMLNEIGISQEIFLLVAKRGLEHPEDKKYYEQIIACENYLYFKNMMIKRNLQLEEQAMQLMYKQDKNKQEDFTVSAEWKNLQKMREANELECAIQMSLALEEEKRKLQELEDEDLMVKIISKNIESNRVIQIECKKYSSRT
jgi:hypothetical protein